MYTWDYQTVFFATNLKNLINYFKVGHFLHNTAYLRKLSRKNAYFAFKRFINIRKFQTILLHKSPNFSMSILPTHLNKLKLKPIIRHLIKILNKSLINFGIYQFVYFNSIIIN